MCTLALSDTTAQNELLEPHATESTCWIICNRNVLSARPATDLTSGVREGCRGMNGSADAGLAYNDAVGIHRGIR